MTVSLLALLTAFGLANHSARADDADIGPLLETLDGAPSAEVHTADGQVRSVQQGEELEYGDELLTGQASARVAYSDGSQVLLASGAAAKLQKSELNLEEGEARTIVEPAAQNPNTNTGGQPPPHKFIIRTRTAVIGVRGTDFVVSSQGSQTSVHTVDGVVDIAGDEASLRQGRGQSVAPGQYSEANGSGPPSPPQKYDVSKYLGSFHQRHPRLAALHEAAKSDASNGRLKQRFQQLRTQPRAHTLRQQRQQQRRQQQIQRGRQDLKQAQQKRRRQKGTGKRRKQKRDAEGHS
jgi:hypothetical protein